MNAAAQLIIFLKHPVAGSVKTRLATAIGPEAAARAYRTMVDDLLLGLEECFNVQLRFTPASAHAAIAPWLRPNWTCAPQSGGDLGERLHDAFEASHAGGFRKTIIIGSDCPYIRHSDIEQAEERLENSDLVLGPARDGGYWLIGLGKPQASLFNDISWSTDLVLRETMERAGQLGLTWSLLRTLTDIDTLEDWESYTTASFRLGSSEASLPDHS